MKDAVLKYYEWSVLAAGLEDISDDALRRSFLGFLDERIVDAFLDVRPRPSTADLALVDVSRREMKLNCRATIKHMLANNCASYNYSKPNLNH